MVYQIFLLPCNDRDKGSGNGGDNSSDRLQRSDNDSDNNDSSESTYEGFTLYEDFQSNLSTNGLMTIQLINLSKITVLWNYIVQNMFTVSTVYVEVSGKKYPQKWP